MDGWMDVFVSVAGLPHVRAWLVLPGVVESKEGHFAKDLLQQLAIFLWY